MDRDVHRFWGFKTLGEEEDPSLRPHREGLAFLSSPGA
jgi:hypothetical protein